MASFINKRFSFGTTTPTRKRRSTGTQADLLDEVSSRLQRDPNAAPAVRRSSLGTLGRRFSSWALGTSRREAAIMARIHQTQREEREAASLDRERELREAREEARLREEEEEAARGRRRRRSTSRPGFDVIVRDFGLEQGNGGQESEGPLVPVPLRVAERHFNVEGEGSALLERAQNLLGMGRRDRAAVGPVVEEGDVQEGEQEKEKKGRRDSRLGSWKRKLSDLVSRREKRSISRSEQTIAVGSTAPQVFVAFHGPRLGEAILDGLREETHQNSVAFRDGLFDTRSRQNSISSSMVAVRDGRFPPAVRTILSRDSDHVENVDPFTTQEEHVTAEVYDIGTVPSLGGSLRPAEQGEDWGHWMSL